MGASRKGAAINGDTEDRYLVQGYPSSGTRIESSSLGIFGPFVCIQSPVVVICALAYGVSFGTVFVRLTNIKLLAIGDFYGFGATQDGLVFLSVLVGAVLGKLAARRLSDIVIKRHLKRCREIGKEGRYEHRLLSVLSGYFLVPAGLVIFGVTLEKQESVLLSFSKFLYVVWSKTD